MTDALAAKEPWPEWIPCTREIDIGDGVFYRPVKMWHSGSYAGEGRLVDRGDSSGCIVVVNGRKLTSPPLSVTHRFYWHKDQPETRVSAFLSYPKAMGYCGEEYFWEICPGLYDDDGIQRFSSEEEMEVVIKLVLQKIRVVPGRKFSFEVEDNKS